MVRTGFVPTQCCLSAGESEGEPVHVGAVGPHERSASGKADANVSVVENSQPAQAQEPSSGQGRPIRQGRPAGG